jgi:hypothetical protein
MQRRIREATEEALESAGYTRYDDGTLRHPPQTCNDASELALAEEAERLLTKRTPEELQEEKRHLEQLIEAHRAGMVSAKTVADMMGVPLDESKKTT